MISEASHFELLENYTKIVTETNALQDSLTKEEEKVKELLNEASLAEKRHITQLYRRGEKKVEGNSFKLSERT